MYECNRDNFSHSCEFVATDQPSQSLSSSLFIFLFIFFFPHQSCYRCIHGYSTMYIYIHKFFSLSCANKALIFWISAKLQCQRREISLVVMVNIPTIDLMIKQPSFKYIICIYIYSVYICMYIFFLL